MAVTQIEHIRALEETLRWFERELQWGVAPRDLGHLVARIGKIFTAISCNGQIVGDSEDVGYNVVGSCGERYLVLCVAGETIDGEINVTREQLDTADRVAVLFFNTDEIEIENLLNVPVEELAPYITHHLGNKCILPLKSLASLRGEVVQIRVVRHVQFRDYTLCEWENGTVAVSINGEKALPSKQILAKIAAELDIPLYNGMERSRNTRLLGAQVMQAIEVWKSKNA